MKSLCRLSNNCTQEGFIKESAKSFTSQTEASLFSLQLMHWVLLDITRLISPLDFYLKTEIPGNCKLTC